MPKELLLHSNDKEFLPIPLRYIGPIKICSDEFTGEVKVPMATLESPLWPSCNRGAKVSRLVTDGISAVILKDNMTRSIILAAPNAKVAYSFTIELDKRINEIKLLATKTSNFAILQDLQTQVVGKLIYLRISIYSKDASGHNMATLVAEEILNWLLQQYPQLQYNSISGNYCIDKKVSAVNGILGRGKYVIAEININRELVINILKTTPEKIVELNIKKNFIGSILAGSIRSANAHFANMLLAIYLATGQDAANIIEGSQGISYAEVINNNLYFSVTLPNIIVGTVGNGKNSIFIKENLQKIGCPNLNARKLAIIIASSVLCGELSLLSAQTNNGELMRSHLNLERKKYT